MTERELRSIMLGQATSESTNGQTIQRDTNWYGWAIVGTGTSFIISLNEESEKTL